MGYMVSWVGGGASFSSYENIADFCSIRNGNFGGADRIMVGQNHRAKEREGIYRRERREQRGGGRGEAGGTGKGESELV
jgi:hypothetical protein